LQGIKRGIMEMADALLITKADADNESKARNAKAEYTRALHFLPPHPSGWIPKVEVCSAVTGAGMDKAYDIIDEFHRHHSIKSHFKVKRQNQNLYWFNKTLQESLLSTFMSNSKVNLELQMLYELVLNDKISPHAAANNLVKSFIKQLNQL
jgi:LAO/AO transport system kinase